MQQLYEVMPTGCMGVNPKLPGFTLTMSLNGQGSTTDTTPSAADLALQKYNTAYAALTGQNKTDVDTAMSQTTVYSSYPCQNIDTTTQTPDIEEWKNFVRYCVLKGSSYITNMSYFLEAWSQTSTGQTSTYSPLEQNRKEALNAYNEYYVDAGATTGVKPRCTNGQVDLDTSWTQNTGQYTYK